MPFTIIKGTFHVVGQNKNGTPTGFEPDGDSIQFKPKNPNLLNQLRRRKAPVKLSSIGSTQLRMQGIDAAEVHYQGWHQPDDVAFPARDFLLKELGITGVGYTPSGRRVKPPANDGTSGYILSNELDPHGRPVAFVFSGNPPQADGSEIRLTTALLKKSINLKLAERGHAFPLYYDNLYYDLRDTFTKAVGAARKAKCGVWAYSPTTLTTLTIAGTSSEISPTIYPKLFRRLRDFVVTQGTTSLKGFGGWMTAAGENDEVWVLGTMNKTHFDNVVRISGNKIALTHDPTELVFVSE